jgi:superfamily II DNA/RNA helicase
VRSSNLGTQNPRRSKSKRFLAFSRVRICLDARKQGLENGGLCLADLNQLVQFHHRPQPKTARVLILTPTRELAIQIFESFRTYGKHLRLHYAVIFGGVGQGSQVQSLSRGVDVLVATPGRLLDLINQRHLNLSALEVFVLDEADRMLDMGFIHDIRKSSNFFRPNDKICSFLQQCRVKFKHLQIQC